MSKNVFVLFCALLVVILLFACPVPGQNSGNSSNKNQVPDGGYIPSFPGTTYFVSYSQGNDSNDGLAPDTAWKTLSHVSGQDLSPGDAVLFRRGDTWREALYIQSSGNSVNRVTYSAYGSGNKPRILGSEQAVGWTQAAANIWQSSTPLINPYQGGYSFAEVFFEELDGTYSWGRQRDYNASYSNMTDEHDWSWNADTIYIYSPSNPATRYHAVEVPQRDSCIEFPEVYGAVTSTVEYLKLDNLEIMYSMRQGIYSGYNEVEAHGLEITNCHIGCIGVKGGASAYGITCWHSDVLIQGNTIHDCGRRGISLNTYTDNTPNLTVSNIMIDNNYIYNGFHTTGPDISTLPNLGHTFTNITISNNIIDDTGIGELEETSNSIYAESTEGNNYSYFYIYNNVIIGSTARAILLTGVDHIYIYNNSIYASHPDARPYSLVTFNDGTNIDFRNNILYGTLSYNGGANDARCVMDQGDSSFLKRDYNLYYQLDSDQPFTGSENGVGGWDVFMDDWNSWRAASGFETHSPTPADPQFVSAPSQLSLSSSSPASSAGTPIGLVTTDILGNPRDSSHPSLGAYE